MVRQQMGAKTHWQESSDLEMMFEGTYTSAFYRTVRNLLHDQVKSPLSPEIDLRWSDLLAHEADYRPGAAAADDALALRAAPALS